MRREENQIMAKNARPDQGDKLQPGQRRNHSCGVPSHNPNARLRDDTSACQYSQEGINSAKMIGRTDDQVVLDRLLVLLGDGVGAAQQRLMLAVLVDVYAILWDSGGRRHGRKN
jgi:hypothetical protein